MAQTQTIRIADLIGKDVTGIRGDVRGGRYDDFEPLVRTLTKCERKMKSAHKGREREPWIYLYWKPDQMRDGRIDCGYSGWQEEHFNDLNPAIIVS